LLSTARQGLPDSLSIAVKAYEADANAHVQKLRHILLAMLLVLLLTLIAESLFLFRPMFRRIREQHQELSDMARTDPLTGSHNRRRFIELAEAELARIRRTGQTASVLILDIDKFKNINDTHGHAIGDEAIRTMAQTCVDQLRGIDIFGRIGGEEFCIVLPETGVDNGLVAAEKLRKAVENSRTPLEDGNHLTFTVSIGLSPMTAETDSLHAAMEQADSNLYKAKQTGRNRVVGPEIPQ
jgi:diguanylate cyclase (GGDEF)-like protein